MGGWGKVYLLLFVCYSLLVPSQAVLAMFPSKSLFERQRKLTSLVLGGKNSMGHLVAKDIAVPQARFGH